VNVSQSNAVLGSQFDIVVWFDTLI